MAFFTDNLRSVLGAVQRFNPFGRSGCDTALPGIFTHQLAVAAYMSSGMLRKVIRIPAADRTQKWRDWQADKATIALIEAEEKRLGIQAKTKHAEILRGIGGGALVLITAGDHNKELDPEVVAKGGLVAVNVASRWEITPKDFDLDLASPTYRQPRMFEVNTGVDRHDIHPSRVICFVGDPVPHGAAVSPEESFWGDCRLLQVYREVERSDNAKDWFAALVKKAKLLRIGIPNLDQMDEAKMTGRVQVIAMGESSLNATLYRSKGGPDDSGEEITDYQVTWAGIPAMMDSFDQAIAAVSDIPFTRLQGRSPAGMNATGEHDANNWHDVVHDGQETETRPCLERLDPILLRSAGVTKLDDVWWEWAPLDSPTEKEKAETFKILVDAIDKLMMTGLVPQEALARAVQNLLEERGDLPGLADALAKLSEDERFGLTPEPDEEDDDPSALRETTNGGKERDPKSAGGGKLAQRPARRAANDMRFADGAEPKTLYIQRKLLNADEVIRWAKSQGLETTLAADDMHVTIAFSRAPVDWFSVGSDWSGDENGKLRVKPGGPREVRRLGDGDAVALLFSNDDLEWRHKRIIEAGATWDWPEYRPHVTLTWHAEGVDVRTIEPYTGPLVFGPELFSEVREDWKATIEEK